jgi:hypothetical protein
MKFSCMAFNIICSIITTPVFYWLIMLEKNSHYRTLINQIISSVHWIVLIYNITMPLLTILIHLNSPTNSPLICQAYFFAVTFISLYTTLLTDVILIVKYLFVFHLKNPTAIQDDFWKILINLWICFFWMISLTVYTRIPGREHAKINVCIGRIPVKHFDEGVKKNWVTISILLFSIVLNIAFWIIRILYKHCWTKKYKEYENYKKSLTNKGNEERINYISLLVSIVLLLGTNIHMYYLSSMNPTELDSYPNYISFYFNDHVLYPIVILCVLIVYLRTNANVRKELWREISNTFSNFKSQANDIFEMVYGSPH